MVVTPPDIPLSSPVVLFIVATAVFAESQEPPGTELLSVAEVPADNVVVPLIMPDTGSGLTVTILLADALPHKLVIL
jgi:hypothetical protein